MNIYEANIKLIGIGNAMITGSTFNYYVVPRTTNYIPKQDYEYEWFGNVDDAYDYAVMLSIDWKFNKGEEDEDMTIEKTIIPRTVEGYPDYDEMMKVLKLKQEMIFNKAQKYGVMVTDLKGNIRPIEDITLDILKVVTEFNVKYNALCFSRISNRISNLDYAISPKDFKNVYFNSEKGTTVIKWMDDTITKVKVQTEKGDTYNPELGMAMCIAKKALGNKGNFNEIFKKFLPKEN